MKKQDYIDAMNEFEASSKLKNETIQKMTKKKTGSKLIYGLATVLVAFVIGISIAIPMNDNKNKVTPIEIIAENDGLPKVENFENFYSIIKNADNSYRYMDYDMVTLDAETAVKATTNESVQENNAGGEGETTDFSKTNVQVEGVDEADIVKTDGEYIYYVKSNKIEIIKVNDTKKMELKSEIKYEDEKFYPLEVYISNNKLVVIGRETNYNNKLYTTDVDYFNGYYGYRQSTTFTVARVYDIENKAKPKQIREVKIEGNYISSRMIDDNVYLVANKYINSYLISKREIDDLEEEDFKPCYMDTNISKELKCIDYTDIYYFPDSEDTSYLNIAGFSINNDEDLNIESYLGAGNEVYSSQDNLYVAMVKWEYKDSRIYGYYNNYDINTYIYKFKLDGSKVSYLAAGSVPGEILNQFSMDEKDGYFRIATTDSENWNSSSDKNNLYVLDGDLNVVGKIENLAKGERIYSVRFMGDKAYVVTFVETDPLFVIDLKDPTNPIVLGELKIPGYSSYLHPYDENHIIGFGEKTKVNEYGGVVTDGMKMALFDVTDPTNPKEMYSVDIGDRWTYSEILDNHKALLFSKEKNIIAFPVYIREETSDYRTLYKFQGAIIYGLDLENGFNLRGMITHKEDPEGYYTYDYDKNVERIIYIKDNFYTLSQGLVKETNMETMQEKSSLELK